MTYGFLGLERHQILGGTELTVQLRRNGLLRFSRRLPLRNQGRGGQHAFYPRAIDLQLRAFMPRVRNLYQAAGLSAPYLLSMMLRLRRPLVGVFGALAGLGEEEKRANPAPRL